MTVRRATAGVVALVLLVAAGTWLWARPRREVPLPRADASPAEVVRAYVDAVNSRDFETANAIDTQSSWQYHRFERSPTMHHLRIDAPTTPGDALHVYVPVRFEIEGGDASMPDGATTWGFDLTRPAVGQRWRITDSGVG